MKLVIAVIQPPKLNAVREALEKKAKGRILRSVAAHVASGRARVPGEARLL